MARHDAEAEARLILMRSEVEPWSRDVADLADDLRAAHRTGAEEMRQRAANACDNEAARLLEMSWGRGPEGEGGGFAQESAVGAAEDCAETIRALPTEPEEGVGT